MDSETQAALEIRDERHKSLTKRVEAIEDVQVLLREDITKTANALNAHQLEIARQYGDLRVQIGEVLPKALSAIPQEYAAEEARKHGRQLVRYALWTVVFTAIGVAVGAISILIVH